MMKNRERDIQLLETSLQDLKTGFEVQLQRKNQEKDEMRNNLDDAIKKNSELIHLINQKEIQASSLLQEKQGKVNEQQHLL